MDAVNSSAQINNYNENLICAMYPANLRTVQTLVNTATFICLAWRIYQVLEICIKENRLVNSIQNTQLLCNNPNNGIFDLELKETDPEQRGTDITDLWVGIHEADTLLQDTRSKKQKALNFLIKNTAVMSAIYTLSYLILKNHFNYSAADTFSIALNSLLTDGDSLLDHIVTGTHIGGFVIVISSMTLLALVS